MAPITQQASERRQGKALGGREQTRDRILSAALILLDRGGRDAVTTRAVAERAGVQPPVIYRLFVDKIGLLDALAAYGFTLYLAKKQSADAEQDPVEALRSGWGRHIQFGLDHPALYLLMYAEPRAGATSAAELSFTMLQSHIGRVAAAGRLRIPEQRAAALFHAAAVGIVLTLLHSHEDTRDDVLSSMARDNVLSTIAMTEEVDRHKSPIAAAATTLHAAVSIDDGFSQGEHGLFKEWLSRLRGA